MLSMLGGLELSRERDIILALNENRRCSEGFDDSGTTLAPKDDRKPYVSRTSIVNKTEDGMRLNDYEEDFVDYEDDEIEDTDLVYLCPECEEDIIADEPITGTCVCPECGAVIEPKYEGTVAEVFVDDEDDDEDDLTVADPYDDDPYDEYDECDPVDEDAELNELKKKVVISHGKKVKKVVGKKGYKVVDGKLVKMSAAEKRARAKAGKKNIKKAQKKGKRMRAKSMKKAMALNNSLDLNFNENAFMELMNGVIEGVMENYDRFENFSITSINEATISERDLDTLTVEATVTYENGQTDNAQFVIEGLLSDDGDITITEMNHIFDPAGLKINGKLNETYNTVSINEMSYTLRNRRLNLGESLTYFE